MFLGTKCLLVLIILSCCFVFSEENVKLWVLFLLFVFDLMEIDFLCTYGILQIEEDFCFNML